MGFSVRVAMLLCVGSIGGMSWVVQQFALPQGDMTAPPGMNRVGAGYARGAGLPNVELVRQAGGLRTEWARQFARPNAIETQGAVNRTRLETVAYLPPTAAEAEDARSAGLPPLVYDPEMVVASAPPADAEWGEVPENGAVLTAAADEAGDARQPGPVAEVKRYRVVKGDTPGRIAQREWNSGDRRLVNLLLEVNPQVRQRGGRILIGEELVIPDMTVAQRALAGEQTAAAVSTETAPKTGEAQWYTIQRNDSLASIAQRFLKDGRRWREIAALNGALDPRKMVPGVRIKLPPVIRVANG